jgi:hypothetical protein
MIVSIATVVFPVANDQLPLATADRDHRVDRENAGL